jgi:protein tyrosine/serine phosphatase
MTQAGLARRNTNQETCCMHSPSNRKLFRNLTASIFAILALSIAAQAQEATVAAPENVQIKIKNFGRMDDRFYRGAQPKEEDFKQLAALGIKTIIDLRDDPEEYERTAAEANGMKYVHIPMIAKKYPTEEATKAFLKIAGNPETGKFYVHCAGGRHRTGAMGAVYRYEFYDWNFDQVYKEMKQFDFYTSWGHGAFKDFVKDYYEQKQASKVPARATASEGSVTQDKN